MTGPINIVLVVDPHKARILPYDIVAPVRMPDGYCEVAAISTPKIPALTPEEALRHLQILRDASAELLAAKNIGLTEGDGFSTVEFLNSKTKVPWLIIEVSAAGECRFPKKLGTSDPTNMAGAALKLASQTVVPEKSIETT